MENNNKNISFEVDLKTEDYLHFNLRHMRATFIIGLILVSLVFIMDTFLTIAIAIKVAEANINITFSDVLVSYTTTFILAILFALFYVIIYISARRSFISTIPEKRKQSFEINSKGIKIKIAEETRNFKWSDIVKYTESKWTFSIFISKRQAFVVPKRCLDEQQIVQFKTFLDDV